MKKWTLLDQALTDDGKSISLHEHDGSYTIRIGGAELMSTREHASEEKLAEFACTHIRNDTRARVLIGGLGFGFTLKAALKVVDSHAAVVVAEISAQVIAWNRNRTYNLAADALDDPRVSLVDQDVSRILRDAHAEFDSVMLDVDNGPAALSVPGNHWLYHRAGLEQIRVALRPGGCVAFWSARPDEPFEKRLAQSGYKVEVERCRSREKAGRWHTIFVGRPIPAKPE